MKRTQCTHVNERGTQCRSTAGEGGTRKRHAPGYVAKPRAAKTAADIAKRPPTNSLGEPWVEGQTWTCTGCGATGPDRDDVPMPASCECFAPVLYAPPEHEAAIRAREAARFPPPPASTKGDDGRTRWNPRWLAFCAAEGLDEDCTRDGDVRQAINARFIAWMSERWTEWGAEQTPRVGPYDSKMPEHHRAFDAWLGAWVERAVDNAHQGGATSACASCLDPMCAGATCLHATSAPAPACGDCGACPLCDAVLAHEDRCLADRDIKPDSESTASAGEADHGATSTATTEPDQLDPVESVEAVDIEGAHDHEADARPSEAPGPGREFHVALVDCVAFLRSLGDETVDLIVTDPAYESLEKHRAHGTTTRLTADWFEIFRNERFPELLAECFRVLKPNAHLYVYSDQETAFVTKPMAEAAGFRWWKHLVWEKTKRDDDEPAAGMGYHYRAAHELIGFYEKGKRRLADLGVCDVLRAPRVKGYPTEKPVSVSRTLIEQSSSPGDLVVDIFMGSASVGEAALLSGRRFAGCDVAERSIELARERLARCGGVEVGPPPGPVPPAQGSLFG